MGNAVPFEDFDLSDMDLSLTSLCEGSNNLREPLMDISFPLSGDSRCVGSASSGGGSFSGGGSSSSSSGGGGVSVGSGSGISGVSSGVGVSGVIGGGSGRGVGGGGSKGGSINNSIEGGGSVVVVIDDEFFDALSDSHCVECQIEHLGSHFDHFDLDSESGQSSDEPELDDNSPDEFVEQNNVNEIIPDGLGVMPSFSSSTSSASHLSHIFSMARRAKANVGYVMSPGKFHTVKSRSSSLWPMNLKWQNKVTLAHSITYLWVASQNCSGQLTTLNVCSVTSLCKSCSFLLSITIVSLLFCTFFSSPPTPPSIPPFWIHSTVPTNHLSHHPPPLCQSHILNWVGPCLELLVMVSWFAFAVIGCSFCLSCADAK